jgi:hypothetical protein
MVVGNTNVTVEHLKVRFEVIVKYNGPLLKLPITKIVIKINIKRYRFMQL